MGRYASYGIVTKFRISLDSLDESIRKEIRGKRVGDYDIDTIIEQFPTQIYDVEQKGSYLYFSLKDSVTAKEIVAVMRDFFSIFPSKFEDIDPLLDKLSGMSMKELTDYAGRKCEEKFRDFTLYGMWYGMKVEVDNHIFYPSTDAVGFLICASYSKMVVEDDIAPFNFLTELLHYRLRGNPLAGSLLSFLSQ